MKIITNLLSLDKSKFSLAGNRLRAFPDFRSGPI